MSIIKKEHIVKELILGESSNIIQGKYVKDEAKAKAYSEGIKLLEKMQGDFTFKADDVGRPQYIHEIEIKWTEEETELSGRNIGNVLSKFDTLIFTREKVLEDTWVLSSEIYKEVRDA